uniref:Uncharacterized protein n=1 Tax=Anguilla anguilla TaxID=7936 RepID=A0A0E9X3J0_ANGAN
MRPGVFLHCIYFSVNMFAENSPELVSQYTCLYQRHSDAPLSTVPHKFYHMYMFVCAVQYLHYT